MHLFGKWSLGQGKKSRVNKGHWMNEITWKIDINICD